MLRGAAIITGLTILGLNLPAPANANTCKQSWEHCQHVAILQCGNQTFVGGSDLGYAENIARAKARKAGFNPNKCSIRNRTAARGFLVTPVSHKM